VAMGKLSLAFRTETSRESLDVYYESLKSLSMYQVIRAIEEIKDNDEFFPKLSRIKTLAKSFKREPSPKVSECLQIEEQTFSNYLPKNKDDFFKAMNKLLDDVSVKTGEGEE